MCDLVWPSNPWNTEDKWWIKLLIWFLYKLVRYLLRTCLIWHANTYGLLQFVTVGNVWRLTRARMQAYEHWSCWMNKEVKQSLLSFPFVCSRLPLAVYQFKLNFVELASNSNLSSYFISVYFHFVLHILQLLVVFVNLTIMIGNCQDSFWV